MTARPSPIPMVPRFMCSVPGCVREAEVRWPGEAACRCDHHPAVDIIDAPEPEVAGDDPAPRQTALAVVNTCCTLGMCTGAALLLVSFVVIAFDRAHDSLAPAWTATGLCWGMCTFLLCLAFYAACLVVSLIREARS